jgi:hypothetical protein
MAKQTATPPAEPTSLQTGNTAHPFASNTLDYSDSSDDILDNFAEGPDDGMPMGLGGEKGKQAEPASSTLEADIVNAKQPGETPPETTDDGPEPVRPAVETTPPEPDEIPPLLLQMAGYADAAAAEADGLGTPEALNAFIRGRGQLLAKKPTEPTEQPASHPYKPATPQASPPKADPDSSEFKPFELSEQDVEILDEQLQDTIRRLNEHNQRQFDALRNSQQSREQQSAEEHVEAEVRQFDQAVQKLGGEWQDVFGEGNFDELVARGQTDPTARLALEYRRELFDAVQTLREVNDQRGLEPMDLQREIGFGLMHRFPDKFHKLLSGSSSEPTQRRTSLNRPTQRRSPDARQDPLLNRLHKKHPGAGFTAQDDDDLGGEI